MTFYELLSICVSIIAIVIAATSLIRTRKVQKITADLASKQLELLQREERGKDKADISVQLVREGSKDFRFVVLNRGKAAAANIKMRINESSPDNPLVGNECERKLPYPRLEPGQSFTLIAALHMQSAMRYPVHIEWENSDGSKESRHLDVIL